MDAAIRQRQQQLALQDEKRALQRLMEDFFKKVDKRAAESAEDVMNKYTEHRTEEKQLETRVTVETNGEASGQLMD